MKQLLVFAAVVLLAAFAPAGEKYVFSADGATAGSAARDLPSQGFDRRTGQVVVGLHARTDEEKAACGWYRVVPTPKPGIVVSNEYWVASGYVFTNCVAVAQWAKRWRKIQPVKYSRLSIFQTLCEIGKWEAAESCMREAGLYEPFLFAQEISSDHPLFAPAKAKIAAALGLSLDVVDALLKECELK